MAASTPSEEEIGSRFDALQALLDLSVEICRKKHTIQAKEIAAREKVIHIAYKGQNHPNLPEWDTPIIDGPKVTPDRDIYGEQIKALEKEIAIAEEEIEALTKEGEDVERKIEEAQEWFKARGMDTDTGVPLK